MLSAQTSESAAEIARLQAERLRAHRVLPSRPLRDARAAAAFVRNRQIVVAAGRSSLPVLSEAIVGRVISGSWMADPAVHQIHDVAFALDERHEFLHARLIQGKRVLLVPALGPAVARIAADPARVAVARGRLSAAARRLLAATEARGVVQLDEWSAGSREARAARLALVRELLVASETVHTAEGRHTAVVRPWSMGEIARRFRQQARAMGYEAARDSLLVVAVSSAVIAPEKEVRSWFVFGAKAIDGLIERGTIRRLRGEGSLWLTLRTG
jgi:hypothetical protein